MELLVYLLVLCVCEVFAVTMAMGLDYYGKSVNYNKVVRKKINVIFIKSNYEKKNFLPMTNRPISTKSFIFQCFNIVYVLIYIVISIVETFVYTNTVIMYNNLISAGVYGLANLFASIWFGVLSERIR